MKPETDTEFEPFPSPYVKGDRVWTTLARTGNVVLLKVNSKTGGDFGWEVCVLVQAPATVIMGNAVAARERLPATEAWGSKGWSYSGSGKVSKDEALQMAWNRYHEAIAWEALSPDEKRKARRRNGSHADSDDDEPEEPAATPPVRVRVRVTKPESLPAA